MMLCDLRATDDPGIHVCHRCQQPMMSTAPPERTYRQCGQVADRSAPCIHLGQQLGLEECNTCQGRVRKKIYHCELHAKCTISQCRQCSDYQSTLPPPQGT